MFVNRRDALGGGPLGGPRGDGSPAATAAPAATTAAKACKIGFSVYDMQYGFFQDMEKGTKEAATAAGCEYVLVDQKSSESTMVVGDPGPAEPGHHVPDHLPDQA